MHKNQRMNLSSLETFSFPSFHFELLINNCVILIKILLQVSLVLSTETSGKCYKNYVGTN